MSYNLLLDSNFSKYNKHWKLINCQFVNGYLISNSKFFGIEQEIVLPDPTKLYFAIDYICFDYNIEKIYCGIQINDTLEVNLKKPKFYKRKRLSVVDNSKLAEKVKVRFIVESKSDNSKIYIDNPVLIDLTYHNKDWWPTWMLDRTLDYRVGYNYENIYADGCEIQCDNLDFKSITTKTEPAQIGILAHVKRHDWFRITHDFIPDHYYLLKLDYKELNSYGKISINYGEATSISLGSEQLYILFKADNLEHSLKIILDNEEVLPYMINLKRLLLIDITNLRIDEDDIAHLPFI